MRKHSTTRRSLLGFLTLALVSALPTSSAHAQVGTPGITITSVETSYATTNFTAGFEFSISTTILVTDLGYFDSGDVGLMEDHEVGIWKSDGTRVAYAVVPAGTVRTPSSGGFAFVSITPVTLVTGQNYRVGGYLGSSRSDRYVYNVPISIAPGISYVRDRYSPGPFSYPTRSDNLTSTSSAGYFGGNFAFEPFSAVPEPSTALAAMGLLGLSAMSRWRRGRAPVL